MSIEFTIVCFNYKVLDYIRFEPRRNEANIARERETEWEWNKKKIMTKKQSIELHSPSTFSSLTSYKYVFIQAMRVRGMDLFCVCSLANTHN